MAPSSSPITTVGLVLFALVATATALVPIVNLGTAGDFAVLAKAGVSTVPDSAITGDVGVSPINQGALTGFSITQSADGTYATSPQVTGHMFAADFFDPTPTKMTAAISDMELAYTDATGRVNPDEIDFKSGHLGGLTLAPGVYKFSSDVNFNDHSVLKGTDEDVWIFQIAGIMSIDAGKSIKLEGGAQAKNIVWVAAGATEFGAGSHFEGIVLGATSATFKTGSSINGRVLVQTAAVLQVATVTQPADAE